MHTQILYLLSQLVGGPSSGGQSCTAKGILQLLNNVSKSLYSWLVANPFLTVVLAAMIANVFIAKEDHTPNVSTIKGQNSPPAAITLSS